MQHMLIHADDASGGQAGSDITVSYLKDHCKPVHGLCTQWLGIQVLAVDAERNKTPADWGLPIP